MRITSAPFGTTKSGEAVTRFTLENGRGLRAGILDYGCTVQRLLVPDKTGAPVDVVLGYDDLAGYETGTCYFGALVGRCANRIRGAAFELNGQTVRLSKNDGENHLHGVFSFVRYEAEAAPDALILRRVSPAGEEGYPGTLTLEVRYSLTDDNALSIRYTAATDADTIVNLTNHSYFNLNGGGDVLSHTLRLFASRFTECDGETLATGRILPVDGTPLDFRAGKPLGDGIDDPCPQIAFCRGFDHNYLIDGADGALRRFAEAAGDKTGITLEAETTQPAFQLYTGNWIDGDTAPCGKGGVRYPRRGGFCLETQHCPCSPNFPQFPTVVLRPGETYAQETVYRFGLAR